MRVSVNLSSGVYIAFCVMAFFATLLLPYETKGRPMQVSYRNVKGLFTWSGGPQVGDVTGFGGVTFLYI